MDTTPLWILAVVGIALWALVAFIVWRNVRKAPVLSGETVMTDDDRWAERALFDYDVETMAR